MSIEENIASHCTKLLKEELKVATGCTEPIAIAYCAAYAARLLGKKPERYEVDCSGNIIKNVKSVTVPNTGGLKGIETAVVAGVIGGDAARDLDVIGGISDEKRKEIVEELAKDNVKVSALETTHPLHIIVRLYAGSDSVSVEVIDNHDGIGNVEVNGKLIEKRKEAGAAHSDDAPKLSIKDILEYANTVNLDEVRELLDRQLEYNETISREGLKNDWGASVGKTLMERGDDCVYTRMRALAAAGSDARMNGCPMPVVINCGSGNQGITCSMPVLEYARYRKCSHDKLLRALIVSDLLAMHQKSQIGRLSAMCGAISAGIGSVAGAAYIDDQPIEVIEKLVINALGTISGMVCDGAKSSCGTKIAASIECALLAYDMARKERCFLDGEGLVKSTAERTISSVAAMARDGMHETDEKILEIMLEK